MISLIFVDARTATNLDRIVPEQFVEHVTQYMIGIFLSEDGTDNSIDGTLPGLVGLHERR